MEIGASTECGHRVKIPHPVAAVGLNSLPYNHKAATSVSRNMAAVSSRVILKRSTMSRT
jgi:hypothetical protein